VKLIMLLGFYCIMGSLNLPVKLMGLKMFK